MFLFFRVESTNHSRLTLSRHRGTGFSCRKVEYFLKKNDEGWRIVTKYLPEQHECSILSYKFCYGPVWFFHLPQVEPHAMKERRWEM